MTAMHVAKGVNASMYNPGYQHAAPVPISVGQAGQFTGTFTVLGQPHTITVDFYGWTPGVRTFTGLTSKGVALPDVVAKGAWGLSSIARLTFSGGTTTVGGGGYGDARLANEGERRWARSRSGGRRASRR